jgi:mRNA-degrading endonuclease toxin of MazEF toxin-antitoxin module
VPSYGLIVWLDDCPPLDDDKDKRRPIIVVDPNAAEGVAIVVCCSATAGPKESDSVPLPNLAETPQCRTGLPRPCAAIPRWYLAIEHEKLKRCEYCGSLGGKALKQVLTAYLSRISDQNQQITPPPP